MFFINLLLSMVPDKVVRGTADAFTEFYRVYLPKVFRYISYKVSDVHLAEDLTSTVFEKALTKFKSYDEKKVAFATWVFRIARNTVIDHFRVSSRQRTVTLDEMTAEPPAEAAHLTEREVDVLRLMGNGDANKIIAGTLGITLDTTKKHVRNVIDKLQARSRTHAAIIAAQAGIVGNPITILAPVLEAQSEPDSAD